MLKFVCEYCGSTFHYRASVEKLIYHKYVCPSCQKQGYFPLQRFVCSNCGNSFYVKKSTQEYADSLIHCSLCEREERPVVYKTFCASCGEMRLLTQERANLRGSYHCLKCGAQNQFDVTQLERYVPDSLETEPDLLLVETSAPPKNQPESKVVAPGELHSGESPRIRRLRADEKYIREYFHNSKFVRIDKAIGDPPDYYVVEYRVRGVERVENSGADVIFRDVHQVEIHLDGSYPRSSPQCRMLTPIFHPNIEPAMICIGDDWSAQEKLADLIVRIGEIITYQSYNVDSPLDAFAAQWATINAENFPIDNCDLFPFDD